MRSVHVYKTANDWFFLWSFDFFQLQQLRKFKQKRDELEECGRKRLCRILSSISEFP